MTDPIDQPANRRSLGQGDQFIRKAWLGIESSDPLCWDVIGTLFCAEHQTWAQHQWGKGAKDLQKVAR